MGLNVPVKTRIHELQQTHDYVPRVEGRLRDIGLEEEADEINRIYDEYIAGVGATYPEDESFAAWLSMPADDWRAIIAGLGRLNDDEGLQIWWLRAKFIDRLRDRLEEME